MSPHRSRSSAPSIVLEADLDDGLLCGRRDVEYHKRSFSGTRSDPAPRVMFSSLCPHAGQRHPCWFPCSWLEAFPINEKLQSDLPARQADCDGAVDGLGCRRLLLSDSLTKLSTESCRVRENPSAADLSMRTCMSPAPVAVSDCTTPRSPGRTCPTGLQAFECRG